MDREPHHIGRRGDTHVGNCCMIKSRRTKATINVPSMTPLTTHFYQSRLSSTYHF